MEIDNYVRRSFGVKAVQVTEQNIGGVAEWLGTMIRIDRPKHGERPHVEIPSGHVHNRIKVPVFVGEWITMTHGAYQRWADKKFQATFQKKDMGRRQKVQELVQQALTVDIDVSNASYEELTEVFTEQVMAIVEDREGTV